MTTRKTDSARYTCAVFVFCVYIFLYMWYNSANIFLEMDKMRNTVIFLIIGIILMSIGFYRFIQYEDHSVVVNAVVTDIKTKDTTDDEYVHTYYGKYTVNGKEYTDVKLEKSYSASSFDYKYHVGDTIEVRVNPENPAKKVSDGGFFSTVGFVIVVYNAVVLNKYRKAIKAAQAEEKKQTEGNA